MMKIIYNLFGTSIGYLVLISIIATIFCIILKIKKSSKYERYIILSNEKIKSLILFCIIVCFLIASFFFAANSFGVKDETGGSLKPHIMIFESLHIVLSCLFLYFHNKRVLFNEIDIKVYNAFGKEKTYLWKDIVSAEKSEWGDLIIKTNNNNKFSIEFYSWCRNIGKFEEELEKRDIFAI